MALKRGWCLQQLKMKLVLSFCLLMVWRIHPSKVGQSFCERLSVCSSTASQAVNKITSWIRNKGNTRAASHGLSSTTETLLEPWSILLWIIDILQAFNMEESRFAAQRVAPRLLTVYFSNAADKIQIQIKKCSTPCHCSWLIEAYNLILFLQGVLIFLL